MSKQRDLVNIAQGDTITVDHATGRVGIGTTSPAFPLDVQCDTSAYGLQLRGRSADNISVLRFRNNAADTTYFQLEARAASSRIIGVANTPMIFYTNNTERMSIDSSGNVGIGTSSPDSLLHLQNFDVTAYSATATDGQVGVGPTIYLENPANANNTVGGQIVFGMRSTEAQARIGATGGDAPALTFGTADAERMRIDASGNLLVGTTDATYRFHVSSDGSAARFGLLTTGRSGGEYPSVGYNMVYNTGSVNTYTRYVGDTASMIRFNSGKVETFTAANGSAGTSITFTQGPYVAQGGTSWTNGSSDVRQKKNFEPSQGLSALMDVEPVKYHFNWEDDTAPKRLGFKAQNILSTIPEMVLEKDELADDGTPYLTITPDYILPVLVKAIQEQQAIIEDLEARLAALET